MIDRLHFISNDINNSSHLQSIRLALDAGCRWIQLRVKDQSLEKTMQLAREAKKSCEQYQARLIINDFPQIAKEVAADGLHLGLHDMPIEEARRIVGREMIIGGTANTFDHVNLRLAEGASYIGLGPCRFTKTKKNLSPVLGLEGYAKIMIKLAAQGNRIPVIAIGGIVQEDIPALAAIGLHGVAISSALIEAQNRKEMVTDIYKRLC